MRVVVPYTEIHPLTDRALRELAPNAERVYLGKDQFGYARLIGNLWNDGESFMIVEHDIELTARALRQARHCTCWYSVSPYRGANQGILRQSLGCTRFSARLIEAFPDAMSRANELNDGGSICPPMHWKRLDSRLMPTIMEAGFVPHVHDEVPHHHVYPDGCACGGSHE